MPAQYTWWEWCINGIQMSGLHMVTRYSLSYVLGKFLNKHTTCGTNLERVDTWNADFRAWQKSVTPAEQSVPFFGVVVHEALQDRDGDNYFQDFVPTSAAVGSGSRRRSSCFGCEHFTLQKGCFQAGISVDTSQMARMRMTWSFMLYRSWPPAAQGTLELCWFGQFLSFSCGCRHPAELQLWAQTIWNHPIDQFHARRMKKMQIW